MKTTNQGTKECRKYKTHFTKIVVDTLMDGDPARSCTLANIGAHKVELALQQMWYLVGLDDAEMHQKLAAKFKNVKSQQSSKRSKGNKKRKRKKQGSKGESNDDTSEKENCYLPPRNQMRLNVSPQGKIRHSPPVEQIRPPLVDSSNAVHSFAIQSQEKPAPKKES